MSDGIVEIAGLRIITSEVMIENVLHPRSPGRARRRAARGYRQHYAVRPMPKALKLSNGTLVMHPELLGVLKARLEARQHKTHIRDVIQVSTDAIR